jgi:hypothetical protein
MPSPLPRWDRRRDRVAPRLPATAAFPIPLPGRLPQLAFSRPAQRSRKLRPACSRGCQATLYIEGSGGIVTSTTAPIATGWSNSCRVGIAPTEERYLFTAHKGTQLFFIPECQSVRMPGKVTRRLTALENPRRGSHQASHASASSAHPRMDRSGALNGSAGCSSISRASRRQKERGGFGRPVECSCSRRCGGPTSLSQERWPKAKCRPR